MDWITSRLQRIIGSSRLDTVYMEDEQSYKLIDFNGVSCYMGDIVYIDKITGEVLEREAHILYYDRLYSYETGQIKSEELQRRFMRGVKVLEDRVLENSFKKSLEYFNTRYRDMEK